MKFKIIFVAYAIALSCFVGNAEEARRGMRVSIQNADGQDVGFYTGSYALVVGASHYRSGWPVLESVPEEIDEVASALERRGFFVTKILDPTSKMLDDAFDNFIDAYGYDPGNRLLFYFSGHGYTLDKGRRGYLVPIDAPDPRTNERNFRRKALDMTRLLSLCREMQAKHALFLFDSCFSGTIFKTRDLPEVPPHISVLTAKPVRQFITAGAAMQSVPALSVFTPTFLKGLRGQADLNSDSYITGTELGMYLHNCVTDYSAANGCPQTPQYGKIRDPALDEGDFVFESTEENSLCESLTSTLNIHSPRNTAKIGQTSSIGGIGVVDMERLIKLHPRTRADRAILEKFIEDFTAEREDMMASLKKKAAEFEELRKAAEDVGLSEKALVRMRTLAKSKVTEIRELEQELRALASDRQKQLTSEELRMRKRVVAELRKIVDEIAKKKKLDLVVDLTGESVGGYNQVIYFSETEKHDITYSVICKMPKDKE